MVVSDKWRRSHLQRRKLQGMSLKKSIMVKPEHVVCASGGKEKLFQHKTITNVSKISSVVPQKPVQSTVGSFKPATYTLKNRGGGR